MTKALLLSFGCLMILSLAGCGLPASAYLSSTEDTVDSTITPQTSTQTSAEVILLTQSVTAGSTPQPESLSTVILQQVEVTPTNADCDQAEPSPVMFDVTVPDDTPMRPGSPFTKTWRFQNTGTCVWGPGYAIVWYSGEDFRAPHEQRILNPVNPGQQADLSLEMMAPEIPGVYSSYWMLRNDRGELFGIGPSGQSSFWVRIRVVAESTPTATPEPEMTATPMVFQQGALNLALEQSLDLDSGEVSSSEQGDLLYQPAGEITQLVALDGSQLMIFGVIQPSEQDCVTANKAVQATNAVDLNSETLQYLCYRTDEGLPGALHISAFDPLTSMVTIEYITWALP